MCWPIKCNSKIRNRKWREKSLHSTVPALCHTLSDLMYEKVCCPLSVKLELDSDQLNLRIQTTVSSVGQYLVRNSDPCCSYILDASTDVLDEDFPEVVEHLKLFGLLDKM